MIRNSGIHVSKDGFMNHCFGVGYIMILTRIVKSLNEVDAKI